jgi:hypothetical protein
MMNHKLKIVLALLFISSAAFAQTGFTFLEIPVGARESALGGAGVALVSGPTSAAHNPAALGESLSHTSFAALTTRHFGDSRASFFGLSVQSHESFHAGTPHFWGTRSSLIWNIAQTRREIRSANSTQPTRRLELRPGGKSQMRSAPG